MDNLNIPFTHLAYLQQIGVLICLIKSANLSLNNATFSWIQGVVPGLTQVCPTEGQLDNRLGSNHSCRIIYPDIILRTVLPLTVPEIRKIPLFLSSAKKLLLFSIPYPAS